MSRSKSTLGKREQETYIHTFQKGNLKCQISTCQPTSFILQGESIAHPKLIRKTSSNNSRTDQDQKLSHD